MLAERDELTAILLAGLDEEAMALEAPPAVRELLGSLPAELRHGLEDAMAPPGRAALIGEVRALLLESLRHTGGEA